MQDQPHSLNLKPIPDLGAHVIGVYRKTDLPGRYAKYRKQHPSMLLADTSNNARSSIHIELVYYSTLHPNDCSKVLCKLACAWILQCRLPRDMFQQGLQPIVYIQGICHGHLFRGRSRGWGVQRDSWNPLLTDP